jgi:hypothetical protein
MTGRLPQQRFRPLGVVQNGLVRYIVRRGLRRNDPNPKAHRFPFSPGGKLAQSPVYLRYSPAAGGSEETGSQRQRPKKKLTSADAPSQGCGTGIPQPCPLRPTQTQPIKLGSVQDGLVRYIVRRGLRTNDPNPKAHLFPFSPGGKLAENCVYLRYSPAAGGSEETGSQPAAA